MKTRVVCFRVYRPLVEPTSARKEGNEAPSLHAGRQGQVRELDHRRQDVHQRNGLAPAFRLHLPRGRDEQRHVEGLLVDEEPVSVFTVVAEAFAVVAGQDDRRSAGQTARVEKVEQAQKLRVDVGDLAQVRPIRVLLRERRRRCIGRVRVIEVDPKKPLATRPLEKFDRDVGLLLR